MAMQEVTSSKGKRKLYIDGYLYIKDYKRNNNIYWKCENFKKTLCKSRVIESENGVIKHSQEHNHAGDAAKFEAEKILQTIREDAVDSRDTPHYIVSNSVNNIPKAVMAKLPTVPTMKRTIRNIRIKHNSCPAIPHNRSDIEFPEIYKTTENGEPFLLYDSGKSENRILIFSTTRNLQLLARSKHWYADGTYKTVPHLFQQLYTIHGLHNQISIPLVYALLPSKTEECYIRFLRALKNLEHAVNPSTIMIDFERAMVNAITVEFPAAIHRGCFFHFCQCLYRNIQSNGLKKRYDSDPEFAIKIRMLSALAFVPTSQVVKYFEQLCDQDILPPEAQPVLDYFEDTWIGRPVRNHRRRPPYFSHHIWNCFDAVQQGLPKTNNSIEGWHRGFQSQISAEHPNIWKFISAIKKEQSLNELKIEHFNSGRTYLTGKKYKLSAETLLRVVNSFEESINLEDYLRGVANNFNY